MTLMPPSPTPDQPGQQIAPLTRWREDSPAPLAATSQSPIPSIFSKLLADPGHDADGQVIPWRPPAQVAPSTAALAAQTAARLRQAAPAEKAWLEGRIMALMAHFFMPGMPAVAWSAIGNDWWRALGHLPKGAIEAACDEWLASGTHRPAPAHIRTLATTKAEKRRQEIERLEILAKQSTDSDLWPMLRAMMQPHEYAAIKAANPRMGSRAAHIIVQGGGFYADLLTERYGHRLREKGIAIVSEGQAIPAAAPEMTDADRAAAIQKIAGIVSEAVATMPKPGKPQ